MQLLDTWTIHEPEATPCETLVADTWLETIHTLQISVSQLTETTTDTSPSQTGMKSLTNAAEVISEHPMDAQQDTTVPTATGNQYKTGCNANIDLPSGFQFDYFQKSFDGDDSNDRLRIGRNGYVYMIDSGSTALERGITTWGTNMPALPYSSNSAARPGTIAPWWGYYSSYYCYDNSNADCGVYVRAMPFEGKGTDVDSDLDCSNNNIECIWDNEGSPYRISPNSDFLSVTGGDLTIEPGTVIQVAQGKGISIDDPVTRSRLLETRTPS